MGNIGSEIGAMLHSAIKHGRQEEAIDMLKGGVSVSTHFENESVIYTTVLYGQHEVLEYILKHRHINVQDGFFTETPLHCACKNGDLKAVEMLINAGATVNAVDHNNCTPLWLAVESERREIVEYLLSMPGLDVDIDCSCKDRFMARDASCTPINKAAEINNTEIVRLLTEYNAKLNIPDTHGKVPLHHACYNGNTEIVAILLTKNCDINLLDEDGISPFYVACKHNHYEIVQILIKAGCDVNKRRSDSGWHCRGFSPLHVATQYHMKEAVQALLEAGADINQGDFRDVQPLALACEEGQVEILNLLLRYNANVNHRDENGSVPLAYCFEYSEPHDVLRRLLEENIDVNVCMFDLEPILHYSVRRFSVDVPAMLIAKGAKLDILDKRDLNALYYAINMGKVATTSVLLVHGAPITDYELENALISLSINEQILHVILDIMDMSFLRNILPKFDSGNKKLIKMVRNALIQPSKLKKLCRDVIRNSLTKKTHQSILPLVQKIMLPNIMLDYIGCVGYLNNC